MCAKAIVELSNANTDCQINFGIWFTWNCHCHRNFEIRLWHVIPSLAFAKYLCYVMLLVLNTVKRESLPKLIVRFCQVFLLQTWCVLHFWLFWCTMAMPILFAHFIIVSFVAQESLPSNGSMIGKLWCPSFGKPAVSTWHNYQLLKFWFIDNSWH